MDSTARLDEEEARRRRTTDCIYFLASPLTCKKGSECEYRHSDAARMNPRDCWYWFHGNCSNPKCSFRHPPLDNNLLGAPTTPRAAQQSAPQASAPSPAQAHGSVPAKQGVPCYYFQKGMCAKGDRCAFLHVPQSAGSGNPSPQPGPAAAKVFTPALQPDRQSKNSWTKPDPPSQQNAPAAGVIDKSKVSTNSGNKLVVQKQNLTVSRADHSSRVHQNHGTSKHYYQPHHQPSIENGLTGNGMEVGEFVREPSTGSGSIAGGAVDDIEQPFKGNHSTCHHQHINGNGSTRQTHSSAYEPERSYGSSVAERLSSERRVSQREGIPAPAATAGSSDLRHRLLKQRKLNDNSGSTEPPARHGTHIEDERSDQHRQRGEHHGSFSRSRLRDRIRLHGERETSFDRLGSRSGSEEWGSRGPPRARQSPPRHSDLRGKLHERLKARSAEETPGSSGKGSSSGEDAGSLNFAGPKSLAELKAKKGSVGSSSGEAAIVKGISSSRVTSEIVLSREATAPFEGPKPLSAILKRKREAVPGNAAAAAQHSAGSIQEAEDAARAEEESQILASDMVGENLEGNGEEEGEEEAFHPEDDVAYDDNVEEAAAAQELEEEHQDDVEVEAEDYDYMADGIVPEEDNDYQEYQDDADDLEDEDDDDFARKVGVMMS